MKKDMCVGKVASDYFLNGFHCAESVASAVLESRNIDPAQATMHATPFGGGVGKSFCDMCGALSGGLIAIGHFHGRTQRGKNWDSPAEMGKELREHFIEQYGETNCGKLRERFGDRQMEKCAQIVEAVSQATKEIIAPKKNADK